MMDIKSSRICWMQKKFLHLIFVRKKMKKIFSIIILMTMAVTARSQSAQQHQPPPSNNFPFTRGMFVDCTDQIILDMKNGNPTGAFDELRTYIKENYIGYIALYDLDQNKVIGNALLENHLKEMIILLKAEFPQLQIGFIGKKSGYSVRTKSLKVSDYLSSSCITSASPYTMNQLDSLINRVGNYEDLQRSETIKFFLRSIDFSKSIKSDKPEICNAPINVFYLEDPYWLNASTGNLTLTKAKFDSYKSILRFLQLLKCPCRDISIEAEFEPTDYFRLSGWTVTDQIEQADPLIDKMMIPFYTSPYNSTGAFDINCKLLHLLSDPFSKNGTNFYIGLSARSNSFYYCNSSTTPLEHLGRYLMGILPLASGNLYSVEKSFLDKLNNPTYMCAGCSCYEFPENQYSSNNPTANMCVGSMWYTFSMLKDHSLFRVKNNDQDIVQENEIQIKMDNSQIELSLLNNEMLTFTLFDIQGRKIRDSFNNSPIHTIEISGLNDGTYFLNAISVGGRHFNRIIPVLYR